MPYTIKKVKGGYAVFNEQTGKRKNKEPMTHEKASAYLGALEAAEGIGKTSSKKRKKK